MSKNKRADEFYKILGLWEDAYQKHTILEDSYLRYVNRLYVKYIGLANDDIFPLLKGLYDLGEKAEHKDVKSIVFHLIEIGGE